jgi:hypothetical protein
MALEIRALSRHFAHAPGPAPLVSLGTPGRGRLGELRAFDADAVISTFGAVRFATSLLRASVSFAASLV